jgi:hypothetical protein
MYSEHAVHPLRHALLMSESKLTHSALLKSSAVCFEHSALYSEHSALVIHIFQIFCFYNISPFTFDVTPITLYIPFVLFAVHSYMSLSVLERSALYSSRHYRHIFLYVLHCTLDIPLCMNSEHFPHTRLEHFVSHS